MILGLGVTFHHQSHIPLLRPGRHRQLLTSPGSPTQDETKPVATSVTFPPGVRSGNRAARAASCAPSRIPRHARLAHEASTRHVGWVLCSHQ